MDIREGTLPEIVNRITKERRERVIRLAMERERERIAKGLGRPLGVIMISRRDRCQATTKAGKQCKRYVSPAHTTLCYPHMMELEKVKREVKVRQQKKEVRGAFQ